MRGRHDLLIMMMRAGMMNARGTNASQPRTNIATMICSVTSTLALIRM